MKFETSSRVLDKGQKNLNFCRINFCKKNKTKEKLSFKAEQCICCPDSKNVTHGQKVCCLCHRSPIKEILQETVSIEDWASEFLFIQVLTVDRKVSHRADLSKYYDLKKYQVY